MSAQGFPQVDLVSQIEKAGKLNMKWKLALKQFLFLMFFSLLNVDAFTLVLSSSKMNVSGGCI